MAALSALNWGVILHLNPGCFAFDKRGQSFYQRGKFVLHFVSELMTLFYYKYVFELSLVIWVHFFSLFNAMLER